MSLSDSTVEDNLYAWRPADRCTSCGGRQWMTTADDWWECERCGATRPNAPPRKPEETPVDDPALTHPALQAVTAAIEEWTLGPDWATELAAEVIRLTLAAEAPDWYHRVCSHLVDELAAAEQQAKPDRAAAESAARDQAQWQRRVDTLDAELAEARRERDAAQQALAAVRDELAEVRRERGDLDAALADAQQALAEARPQPDYEAELADERAKVADLRARLDRFVTTARTTQAELRGRLAEAEDHVANLTEQRDALVAECDHVKAERDLLAGSVQEATRVGEHITSAVEELRAALARSRSALSAAQAMVSIAAEAWSGLQVATLDGRTADAAAHAATLSQVLGAPEATACPDCEADHG